MVSLETSHSSEVLPRIKTRVLAKVCHQANKKLSPGAPPDCNVLKKAILLRSRFGGGLHFNL
ncbi:MAG: hypothetical protein CMM01_25310 [Rhodopirellula sp.]|nr:hypothetical protein [Rhodopirellula sp.]